MIPLWKRSFWTFGRAPERENPRKRPASNKPDWVQANPARIDRALRSALARPSGGWAVLDASDRIGAPRRLRVAGQDLVVWRSPDGPRAAPDRCPHMGAPLCAGRVDGDGRIVCPWHGLRLGDRARGAWSPFPTHDDGVLAWVRMPSLLAPGEAPTAAPMLPARPQPLSATLRGVICMEARCEPQDVIANRLDPWHGVHFHPHSFLRLSVLDEDEHQITVRVVYRVLGPLGMEVDARFDCPDPRTICMTIVAGEAKGSVVETHATPVDQGRTRVVEAAIATSDRPLFALAALGRGLIRPLIERRFSRLWVEDIAYAERTYALRNQPERQRGRPALEGDVRTL